MNRRRVLTSAAVVAAVGALTAVTIPAIAGTQSRTPATESVLGSAAGMLGVAPPEVDVELAPELLAALARDLDLSAEQAQARLGREAWAGRTAAALRDDLAEQYAGAWYAADGDTLMVGVTDEAAAERVRAAGAEPKLVARSETYLDGVKASLDAYAETAAGATADSSVAGWYVDPASNTVVVIGAESAARELAVSSGVWGDAVRVVETDEQPRLLNDVRGGDPYFINNSARCSVGFSVVGGFVTAGHCAAAGAATTGFNGLAQGQFVAASFPGVGAGGPDDWGVVEVNDDWVPQPVVTDFAGGELPVAGAEEAPIGAAVCKHGSTTGVSCGVIQAKNTTVNYPEGLVTGLTRTSACAEPGDSGGAWLAGDQAQGITSGGSGDCTNGGLTFFQPLTEVLELNQLTLVTTGDEVPPAEDVAAPPVTAGCDQSEHTFRGWLSPNRTVQVQPNGRYYRVTAPGTHAVCLAGPADAGFDLTLQQWDGRTWQDVDAITGPGATGNLSFAGDPGFYRITVTATAGSGRYQVGLTVTPR